MKKRNVYWGDFHKHLQELGKMDQIVEKAREHLDFYPLLCYPFVWFLQNSDNEKKCIGQPTNLHQVFPELDKKGGLLVESVEHRDEFDQWWEKFKVATEKHNSPGEFVTILGYEWHGDRRKYGDHNVFYFDPPGPLDPEPELPDLYEKLEGEKALVIPHHMGYKKFNRGKDWDYWSEELSPVAEVFSQHGSSETEPSLRPMLDNVSMGPRNMETTWQAALDRGHRVGAIASNDGPGLPGSWGNGLAAVWAKSLTREGIWEALQKRRTYGVTGDRIELSFFVNNRPMGDVIKGADSAKVDFEVNCPNPLDRVELVVNGNRQNSYYHADTDERTAEEEVFNFQVDFGWGPAKHYGLKEKTYEWKGELHVEKGELLDVQKAFSRVGQKVTSSANTATWNLKMDRRNGGRESGVRESLIFSVKGSPETELLLSGKNYQIKTTLKELASGSRIVPLKEEAIETIEKDLGVTKEMIVNKDVYYFNSPKIKLHKAATRSQRYARGSFEVSDLEEGRNYIYLRVLEINGQMAWSSPVWIDR